MALAAVPFVAAYRRFATGDFSPGDFAASVVALAAVLATMRVAELERPLTKNTGRTFNANDADDSRIIGHPDADRVRNGGAAAPLGDHAASTT